MSRVTRTFLVECFWPGVTPTDCSHAATRAQDVARRLQQQGHDIDLLDTMLMRDDEVAFFRFSAPTADHVTRASDLAQLPYERITEYVEVMARDDG